VDVTGLNLPGIDFISLQAGYGLAPRREFRRHHESIHQWAILE